MTTVLNIIGILGVLVALGVLTLTVWSWKTNRAAIWKKQIDEKRQQREIEQYGDQWRPSLLLQRKQQIIATQIRNTLSAKYMTVTELARKAGLDPLFVFDILDGEVNLNLETLSKIEAVLEQEILSPPYGNHPRQFLEPRVH